MKPQFPSSIAQAVADEIIAVLGDACDRIAVAGSLRRRKSEVGDVEILYIPKEGMATPAGEIFAQPANIADLAIARLESSGVLSRRKNVKGSETFGEHNKLMLHKASGVPVDLFATTAAKWFVSLVVRTGGKMSNVHIASAARERGYSLNAYGEGFTRLSDGEVIPMESEEAVFKFVGMKFREPWERL